MIRRNAAIAFLLPLCVTCLSAFADEPSDEEASIEALVKLHFSAFAKQDLEGVISCWSKTSPEYEAVRKSASDTFQKSTELNVRALRLSNWKLTANTMKARLAFQWERRDAKTDTPISKEMVWNVSFVKENGSWLWWQRSDAFADLAKLMLAASEDADIEALLTNNHDLATGVLVDVLLRVAENGIKTVKYIDAEHANHAATLVANAIHDEPNIRDCHEQRFRILVQTGRLGLAEQHGTLVLELVRKSANRRKEAEFLAMLGAMYRKLGNSTKAIERFNESIAIWEDLKDLDEKAKAMIAVAEIYRTSNRPKEALSIYEQLLVLAISQDNPTGQALALNNGALCETALGELDQALTHLESSLAIKRSPTSTDELGAARTLNAIGSVFQARGDFATALAKHEECRKIARGHKDAALEAAALNNIGLAKMKLGRYDEAKKLYRTSLGVAQRAHDGEGEALALGNLGAVALEQGDFDEAIRKLKKSADLFGELHLAVRESEFRFILGEAQQRSGSHGVAADTFQRVATLARQSNDAMTEMRVFYRAAKIYQATDQMENAAKQLASLCRTADESGKKTVEIAALIELAALEDMLGRRASSIVSLQKAAALSRSIGALSSEATATANSGLIHLENGEFRKAKDECAAALVHFRQLQDPQGEAMALRIIGSADLNLGNFAESRNNQTLALEISRRVDNRLDEASALNNLGLIEKALGHFDLSANTFREALAIFRELSAHDMEASTLLNVAGLELCRGDLKSADAKLKVVIETMRRLKNKSGEAGARNSMGIALDSTGHYAEALLAYQESLKIYSDVGNDYGKAVALANIAGVYGLSGKYLRQAEIAEEALEIDRRIGNREGECVLLNNLGHALTQVRRPEIARSRLQEALNLAREIGSKPLESLVLTNFGDLSESLNQFEDATRYYNAVLVMSRELPNKLLEARTLTSIGDVYRKTNEYVSALRYYTDAQSLSTDAGDVENVFRTYWGIGSVYRAERKWLLASEAFRIAIRALETIRTQARDPMLQVHFFAQYTPPYFLLADCLLQLGDIKGAFAASEQSKGRVLHDIMRAGGRAINKTLTEIEQSKERELQAGLRSLRRQVLDLDARADADRENLFLLKAKLKAAESDYATFRQDLNLRHKELQAWRGEFDAVTDEQFREVIFVNDPGICVLSFLVGDEETLLFVLKRSDDGRGALAISAHRIPFKKPELEEIVQRLWRSCATVANYKDDARALYMRLLGPAVAEGGEGAHLVIVPDGILNLLPFQVLMDGGGKHLIETHVLSYVSSCAALIEMRRRADQRKNGAKAEAALNSLFAMGFPTYPTGAEFVALGHTKTEVIEIAALFGSNAWLGDQATEARAKAKMGHADVVFLSTHAKVDWDEPNNSYVALAEGDGEDGYLHAYEISDLELFCDLVVLSACSTGGRQGIGGEGILGLSWAVFIAGAPTTVVSKWQILSASSAQLMIEFSKELHAPSTLPSSKSSALRKAQLKMMSDPMYSHPYYWAAFAVVGSW